MPQGWEFSLLVAIVLLVVGWFAVGTQWNVRKGDRVLKWLRQGLPLIGERSTMRWLGSSVIELKIAKAKDPFRTAETLVAFEPRDVFFLWAIERVRGRRDTLIFRSQLRTVPEFEIEVFDPKGWTRNTSEKTLRAKNWVPLDLSSNSPLVGYGSGAPAIQVAKPLVDLAARTGGQLVRLSVHRKVPNLEVHWILPDPGTQTARDFFLKLRQIGEQATGE